ncbi:MAG TPA: inositol monophosphatase family protein [Thermoanaerobaculia bacterium]|nr:inositol monophosphatase family protein [Thermoanaerobaculia bacterium]
MLLNGSLCDLAAEDGDRIEAALTLLRRQAVGAARLQGRVAELRKVDESPVTVVDLLHQTQLQQLLRREFPDDALLCEEPRSLQERHAVEAAELSRTVYEIDLEPVFEELPATGRRVWVLDPIDGTKGFLAGRYFAIALACFVDGVPRFAAMAVPGGNDARPLAIDRSLAFAVAGRGAWISAIRADAEWPWRRLGGRDDGTRGGVRVAVSLAHGGPLARRLRETAGIEVIELDSQAKYLAVATGDIDAYLRAARDDGGSDVLWDHLPGGLIALEAGCSVRHFDGGPVEYAPCETIAFRGGVVCWRDREGGRVSRTIDELLRRQTA